MLPDDSSLEAYAKHYVETIMSPPNAWGQHLSVRFGQSHNILGTMYHLFGANPSIDAIALAQKAYNGTHSSNA